MLEADFQSNVVELAQITGWQVHHSRKMQDPNGNWRTPIQGDVGFPDLVLARRGRVVFAELKSEKGTVDDAQELWLQALSGESGWKTSTNTFIGGARLEVHVWRPRDMDRIAKILSAR